MAGKLHFDYQRYIYAQPGGVQAAPGTKPVMAYSEGYVARRKGAAQATNPHPVGNSVDRGFWDKGWSDGNNLYPSTHVGGPTPV